MNIQELIIKIRKEFDAGLARKTGWGKNEVMILFDSIIAKVVLEELNNRMEAD